jgi:hypothetical protein
MGGGVLGFAPSTSLKEIAEAIVLSDEVKGESRLPVPS